MSIEGEETSIDKIILDPHNANRHTERGTFQNRKSVGKFGARGGKVLDKNNIAVTGNLTTESLADAGIEAVIIKADPKKAYYLKYDDLDMLDPENPAREFSIVDNQTALTSIDFDPEMLTKFDEWGIEFDEWFNQDELDELGISDGMTTLDPAEDAGPQTDKADELREKWGTEAGQLWILPARNGGQHRLLIGDCTDAANVERLMNGERAEMCFTSPPYSDQRTYDDGTNINVSYLKQFIPAFADYVNYFCVNLGLVFRNHEPVEYWQEYIQAARDCGLKLLAWNVWNKNQPDSIGHQTMMFGLCHEWIFVFGASPKKLNRTIENSPETEKRNKSKKVRPDGMLTSVKREMDGSISETSYGVGYTHKQLSSVLSQYSEKSREFTRLHPAIMRSEVAEEYIKAMTNEGEIVGEPFAGSGTTLIAAENLNRLCYCMELSLAYSAVILQRYYDTFDIMPELAKD